jgi:hypothetical protein
MNAIALLLVMIFAAPVPFAEALQSREVRSILPTNLGTADLENISQSILSRSIFSARVANTEFLQSIDDALQSYINGEIGLAEARTQLQDKLGEIGYSPDAAEAGKITDFASDARLNLILETNAEMASGYGQWSQGQNAAILDEWPAQELIRIAPRKMPRDWPLRWADAGGAEFDGRMIAPKNDDVWTKISRFGSPYPPFDFGSGMGVRDIARDEAVELGVVADDTVIEPESRDFNEDLQFTPEVRSEALQQVLVDAGYKFNDGVLTL